MKRKKKKKKKKKKKYMVAPCWLFLCDLYYDARNHEHQAAAFIFYSQRSQRCRHQVPQKRRYWYLSNYMATKVYSRRLKSKHNYIYIYLSSSSSSSSRSKRGVRRVACSLILQVKLVRPSLPRSSYVPLSV